MRTLSSLEDFESKIVQEGSSPSEQSFFDYVVLSTRREQASSNEQPASEIIECLSIPLDSLKN
jgi:hypothetical protein